MVYKPSKEELALGKLYEEENHLLPDGTENDDISDAYEDSGEDDSGEDASGNNDPQRRTKCHRQKKQSESQKH